MNRGGADDPRQQAFQARVAELERRFRGKLAKRASELEAALAEVLAGEAAAETPIRTIVHKLAGSAGSFGEPALSESAVTLDTKLRADTPVGDLADELRALAAAMRAAGAQPE